MYFPSILLGGKKEEMRLTQEIIDKIQIAMVHTKKDGTVNWMDGDELEVCLGGTFAADKFITIINRRTNPRPQKNEPRSTDG